MIISVNNKEIEVSGQLSLLEELTNAGYSIPSLCYAKDAKHQPSCMVCMVRNVANDQMIPSCSTFPTEGMQIDVDSKEVLALRRMSLELLLSDHRADCEAPCSLVCPAKIDVARILLHYDRGQMAEAKAVLTDVADAGDLPCNTCKGGCEKACRRKTIDANVAIRDIIKEVAASESQNKDASTSCPAEPPRTGQRRGGDALSFSSKLGRYTEAEKAWLKDVYNQPSHCLHCACEGQDGCKLRKLASEAGIKAPRYGVSSKQIVKEQKHIVGRLYFEPAKCVRCGLCVYNSNDGFTFQHRGFGMQVVIPEQSRNNVEERLAELCPTGALFLIRN